MLIDSHCHFDFSEFDSDRNTVWDDCLSRGVANLIIPGVSPDQWVKAQRLCERLEGVYFSVGLHPWWVQNYCDSSNNIDSELEQFSSLLHDAIKHPLCVGVGECGLDRSIETPLQLQQPWLDLQCEFARSQSKALILHAVKAHELVLCSVKKYGLHKGIIHAFSGSTEQALNYTRHGFCLGVGGIITYERAGKTREAICSVPLDALVLETDAPDSPLCGKQGERNSPVYLPEIAAALATLRNETYEEICRQTSANARRVYDLQD